jgi:hypothetical protein
VGPLARQPTRRTTSGRSRRIPPVDPALVYAGMDRFEMLRRMSGFGTLPTNDQKFNGIRGFVICVIVALLAYEAVSLIFRNPARPPISQGIWHTWRIPYAGEPLRWIALAAFCWMAGHFFFAPHVGWRRTPEIIAMLGCMAVCVAVGLIFRK